MLLNEHQGLLMKRESRVVLGRYAVNLWLLTLVLTIMFFAISFSVASTNYLADKMNDPFTNWVNIDLSRGDLETIRTLKQDLENDSVQGRYGYNGIQSEVNSSINLVDRKGRSHILSTLFYETLSSDLISAVLSEENVVNNCSVSPDSISKSSLGIVLTEDALIRLGYDEQDWPSFVDYHSKSTYADTLGIKMLEDGVYSRAPLPLLAVVKRLPMNKEAIASKYLNEVRIKAGNDCPIDLNHENYARELFYFVPEESTPFNRSSVKSLLSPNYAEYIEEVLVQPQILNKLRPWKTGSIFRIYLKPGTLLHTINSIEQELETKLEKKGIDRIYNYDTVEIDGYTSRDNVFSVHFTTLDSISAFENFVKQSAGIQIEMTQVNSKKNFWAVSGLAAVLTAGLITFSIISIIIFIINMLHNYFQKVKRNLGTFKAFGISNNSLIMVYTIIILLIVFIALFLSLMLVWITQMVLPSRQHNYDYLCLWNPITGLAIGFVVASVFLCVYIVMKQLLHSTPGDLIYDR